MKKTLYAYSIENDKLSKSHSDFTAKFIKKLKTAEKLKVRCYEVNSETKESDLLVSSSIIGGNKLYGVLVRIKPTKDMPSLPVNFLELETINISDLLGKKEGGEKMSCKDIDYFMVDNEHLVTTIPTTRIARFKTYANFVLTVERGDTLYNFTAMIEAPKDIKLQDLTQIVFSGNSKSIAIDDKSETVGTKIISMAKDKLASLVNDSDIQFLIDKKVLTANLVIKFNTRSTQYNSDDAIKKAMSAVVTHVTSEDDVQFATKNKQKITAGSTRRCKVITLDDAENGQPNEEGMRQEMSDYLNELKGLAI